MYDITNGKLQIVNITRVEEVRLRQCHLVDKKRVRDSFVYVLEGKVDYNMKDGKKLTFSAGDVYYLPLHCAYTMDVYPEGLHYIVCNFQCLLEEPRRQFYYSAQNPQSYEKLFRALVTRFSGDGPERMAESMAALYSIYARIVRHYHPTYVSGAARRKIQKARDHILQNLSDRTLSVSQLAGEAKMSQVHFRRLFHAMYNTSPTKYITAARVTKAKSLLEMSEMRLEDVAEQAGFGTVAYLCTVFKAATGLTPSQYRKEE